MADKRFDRDAKPAAAIIAAATIAIAATLIKPWEGKRNAVYLDIVGIPTACYGQTGKGIRMGQRYTDAECEAMLDKAMGEYYGHVKRCIIDRAEKPLHIHQAAALTSFAYNVGPGGVCGSTLQRHAIKGEHAQMCGQLMRWVYAGGKRVQGLVNRRQAEYRVCMGLGYQ